MTLDQLCARDGRIAALDAKGRARTPAERNELAALERARDNHWQRVADQLSVARRRAADLETYMRQHRLPLPA